MKQLVVGASVVAAVAAGVVVLSGAGASGETQRARAVEPRSVCETRRGRQDLEVLVRLQLTDRQLDMAADGALVVADLGRTTQTRVLRSDDRVGGGYAVTFEDLPADVAPSSFSVRASPSPDDPASFECDSTAAAAGRVVPASAPALLPATGG